MNDTKSEVEKEGWLSKEKNETRKKNLTMISVRYKKLFVFSSNYNKIISFVKFVFF